MNDVDSTAERALGDLVRPGSRVAVADACGLPYVLTGPLSRVAARAGGVRLVLGWIPGPAPDLDPDAFADIRTVVGGPGARGLIESGAAHRVPARLSAVPALLAGPLRPDLLLATVVEHPDGYRFGAESSWMRGLAEDGVPVAAVVARDAPGAEGGAPLPDVTVLGETEGRPFTVDTPPPTDADRRIAERVAPLVPAGARIQFGPGRLATALVAALDVGVHVDSGLLADPVVDLAERGLLLGTPSATALHGSRRLYDWADGRTEQGVVRPIEYTHDLSRLSTAPSPLIALNTALEIDVHGQVNVEGVAGSAAGMIGGHPDFAAAAARGPGLSVIALASEHRGRPTLVERLGGPVTTPSHDVDVVVTDRGSADLRGLGREERERALAALWRGAVGANE